MSTACGSNEDLFMDGSFYRDYRSLFSIIAALYSQQLPTVVDGLFQYIVKWTVIKNEHGSTDIMPCFWRIFFYFFNTARADKASLRRLTYLRPYGILVTSRTTEVARLIVLSTCCPGGPVTGHKWFSTNSAWPWNFEGWSTLPPVTSLTLHLQRFNGPRLYSMYQVYVFTHSRCHYRIPYFRLNLWHQYHLAPVSVFLFTEIPQWNSYEGSDFQISNWQRFFRKIQIK